MTNITEETTITPGTYLLSDPCYSFNNKDETWGDWLQETSNINHNTQLFEGKVPNTNTRVTAFATLYGDGVYPVYDKESKNKGPITHLGVDAGLIGLVPVNTLATHKNTDHVLITLDEDTKFTLYDDGTITLGDRFTIKTGDDFYDENETNEE